MKRLCVMLSVFVAVSVAPDLHAAPKLFFEPDGFEQFHTHEGTSYLADFDGVTTDGNQKIIWMRRIEAESPGNKQRVEYATEYQYKISCSSDRIHLIQYAAYRSNGEEIYSQIVNTDSTIIPGTYLDTLLNIVCGKHPLGKKKTMTFCTSTQVPVHIIESYGDKRLYSGVEIMKTSEGSIGGFVIKPSVMDSPITFLDCNGKFLALFHVFDSMETKENAMKIIDPLSKAFPVRVMLDFKAQGEAPKK